MPLDSLEYIQNFPHSNLYEWVLECKEKIPGIIEASEDEIIDTFLEYEKFSLQWEYIKSGRKKPSKRAREVESNIKKWLIKSGQAVLITALDWSVDRHREAEQSLGLRQDGYLHMQNVLAEKYGWESPVHLHKGPGNGGLYQSLAKSDARWKQIAIGDRLYFTIEDVLNDFIRDRTKTDLFHKEFVEKILANILKKGLREKWFDVNSKHVEDWKLKDGVEYPDLNDVFEVLDSFLASKDFEDQLNTFFSIYSVEIRWSQFFELDTADIAPLHIAIIVLKLLFPKGKQRGTLLKLSKSAVQDRIIRNREFLESLKGKNLQELDVPERKKIADILKNLAPGRQSIRNEDELDIFIDNLTSAKRYTDQMFSQHDRLFQAESVIDLFTNLFSTWFIEEIARLDWERDIDLNEHAHMYFGNFVQWDFLDIPYLVSDTPNIISATRSDSHLSNVQFEKDIRQNLEMLPPGGVLISDGIRQSYSNYFRIDQVQRVVEQLWKHKYKVDYVVNAEWEVLSVFIQRRHKTGYLKHEEKKVFFSEDVVFQTSEEISEDPFFTTTQSIKRKVLRHVGGNSSVFERVDLESMMIREMVDDILYTDAYNDARRVFHVLRRNLIQALSYNDMIEILERDPNLKISNDTKTIVWYVKSWDIPDDYADHIENENLKESIYRFYEIIEDIIITGCMENIANDSPMSHKPDYCADDVWEKFIESQWVFQTAYKEEARRDAKNQLHISRNSIVKGAENRIIRQLKTKT